MIGANLGTKKWERCVCTHLCACLGEEWESLRLGFWCALLEQKGWRGEENFFHWVIKTNLLCFVLSYWTFFSYMKLNCSVVLTWIC